MDVKSAAMEVKDEGNFLILIGLFGFVEASRYTGFRQNDDVFGLDAGLGMGPRGNDVCAHESLDFAIFVDFDKWR